MSIMIEGIIVFASPDVLTSYETIGFYKALCHTCIEYEETPLIGRI